MKTSAHKMFIVVLLICSCTHVSKFLQRGTNGGEIILDVPMYLTLRYSDKTISNNFFFLTVGSPLELIKNLHS